MAIVTMRETGFDRMKRLHSATIGPQSMWKTAPRKRASDPYFKNEARGRPPNLDPYLRPGMAGLGGLGDIAGGTGIDFIDQNLGVMSKNIADAAFAAKVTMYCSIAAGIGTVLLIIRTGGRR